MSPKRSEELMALLPESCCNRDLASYCVGEKTSLDNLWPVIKELIYAKLGYLDAKAQGEKGKLRILPAAAR